MILLTWLLQRMSVLSPGSTIQTLSLMAPAGTLELFTGVMQPFLKAMPPAFHVSEAAIYNLTGELEQDDKVTMAYNKSLLFLVANAFEEVIPARILGMEESSKLVERRNIPRLSVYYSQGDVPGARVTASQSHGGFDNDPSTMNHILRRVLKKKPEREFSGADLK
jgi:hypothetical protein